MKKPESKNETTREVKGDETLEKRVSAIIEALDEIHDRTRMLFPRNVPTDYFDTLSMQIRILVGTLKEVEREPVKLKDVSAAG